MHHGKCVERVYCVRLGQETGRIRGRNNADFS